MGKGPRGSLANELQHQPDALFHGDRQKNKSNPDGPRDGIYSARCDTFCFTVMAFVSYCQGRREIINIIWFSRSRQTLREVDYVGQVIS